jgi:hypothetical protein
MRLEYSLVFHSNRDVGEAYKAETEAFKLMAETSPRRRSLEAASRARLHPWGIVSDLWVCRKPKMASNDRK